MSQSGFVTVLDIFLLNFEFAVAAICGTRTPPMTMVCPADLGGGATVSQECITAYNDLKLSKKYKYIIFKLSDDFKEIVIEEASDDKDWDNFREKLIKSTTKNKSGVVGKGCRYAVYDFEYSLATGDGVRNKITFIAWSPDDAGVQPKMIYASSKEALKRSLTGIATELQANDADDIEHDTIVKTVSKGLAG
ncbi:cofilin/tropomyosin-type actin-binding protein [Metarhizium robertsii ARSEF 23]|uniref:Cofilin n=1 Tax=Metarhizium robertsii (strain ARSEF 23 / ATCC MYA-3075) TaxID=655844 RepID=E9F5Y7_METRA|nr:cofilin/tropomyosin-type actin-binding protein [Metarhizium robertsii ARSEF 23]EFY96873.2 cofilin/tropomyosin-type actin-binding protein [Metarhizium robertsii ARSEF 23]